MVSELLDPSVVIVPRSRLNCESSLASEARVLTNSSTLFVPTFLTNIEEVYTVPLLRPNVLPIIIATSPVPCPAVLTYLLAVLVPSGATSVVDDNVDRAAE